MQIDTSIYGGIQPVQIESPINKLAQIAQLQGAQRQNQLAEMQMATARRAEAGENALNSAYQGATGADGTIDRNKLYSGVAQSGQGSKLPGIQKGFSDMDKSAQEASLAQLNTHLKTLDVVSQSLGPTLQNPAMYPQVRAALMEQYPEGAANLPVQFDPAAITAVINKTLTAKDQIGIKQKEIDQALEKDKFKYQQGNDAANRNVTMRGQNMTDARQREATEQKRQADGTPSAKPLTEGQSKAALFGSRMQSSDQIINDLAAKGINNSVPGSNTAIIGPVISAFSPAERQQLDQAKRDFINATLRRESGAVISPEEFSNGERQYFPTPGDKPATIAQKQRNRAIATRGILAEVPDSRREGMVKQIIGDNPKPSGGVVDFGSLK